MIYLSITLSFTEVHVLGKTPLFHLLGYALSGMVTDRQNGVVEIAQTLASDKLGFVWILATLLAETVLLDKLLNLNPEPLDLDYRFSET